MITLGWVTLLLLMALFAGLPVAFALGSTSVLLIGLFELPMRIVANTMFTSLDSFVVIAIPLFILMSRVLLDGRVGDDLFEVMNVWVRHLPGGLAIATILACAFFAAISGSGAATAATIGMVAYPAMLGRGYQKKFILGLLACGGTLGILIPPSIPLIIFGAVTDESIGKLFIAGIVPGLVLTGVLIVYAVYRSKRGGYQPMEAASWSERFQVTRRNLWGIALPFIILGGIYTGVFTPTEAAAVGLTYSLFITLCIYRTLKLRDLPKLCLDAVGTSCMIALIIAAALLFGRVMTVVEDCPDAHGIDHQLEAFRLHVRPGDEHPDGVPGVYPGDGLNHPAHRTAGGTDHDEARDRSHLVRHRADGQHGDGAGHSPRGDESVRHQRPG